MNITRDEARRIAALAHLEFDDAALDRLAAEMTKILRYIDQLPAVEESPLEEGESAPLRDDVARPYPRIVEGFFVVPKVIE